MLLAAQLIFHDTHSLLELELGAELKLPRRPAIAGGKARSRDLAEACGLHIVRRLTEVGVIENVKRIHAQSEGEALEQPGLLLPGKIEVRESRSDAAVALHI